MATATETAAPARPAEQVRIRLSTRDPTVELPERPGPILVSTMSETNLGLPLAAPFTRSNFEPQSGSGLAQGLRRYALSTLVNTLLSSAKPIPFEFLVNGEFLRTTLDDYLTAHGVSAETTLSLEYVRALTPPTQQSTFEHDDWVGAVDVLSGASAAGQREALVRPGHERILSGSYDGLLRVWSTSGAVLATSTPFAADDVTASPAHVLAARFVAPALVASSGYAPRIRLWHLDEDARSLAPALDLFGHRMRVNSLDVAHPSPLAAPHLLSASNDCTAALWSTSAADADAAPAPTALLPSSFPASTSTSSSSSSSAKRRRATPQAPTLGPLATLKSHTRPVRAAVFSPTDSTVAYTASDDRTLKVWDLVTARCVSTRTPGAGAPLTALCAAAAPALAHALLAAGTAARTVLLVDPREPAGTAGAAGGAGRAAVATLRGHAGEITALAAQPASGAAAEGGSSSDSAAAAHDDGSWGDGKAVGGAGGAAGAGAGAGYALASASFDGTVRVWDLRSPRSAAYAIPRAAGGRSTTSGGNGSGSSRSKVFGVAWDARVGVVSGGEDGRVQVDHWAWPGSG